MSDPSESVQESFTQFYRTHRDGLFRYSVIRLRNREVALELVQDVFIKYWNLLESGTKIRYPKALLYKMMTNAIIDHVRKVRPTLVTGESAELLLESIPSATATDVRAQLKEALAVLESLSKKDATLLTLRLVEGLSFKEIAQVVGMRENAATVAFHRAKKRLDKALNPYE